MYKYVLILSIFGAFFFEVSGFQCLLNRIRDSLLPIAVVPEKWQKLCSKPENLEAHIHNLAKICSVEINKDDVALWVQRACKKKEGFVTWKEISCLLKRFDASDGCEFNTDINLPTFRTACLWGLWEYYNCLVKDVYNHCGENASHAMRFCTKSFHILVRHTCMKKKTNDLRN